jgi:hypothetical protein
MKHFHSHILLLVMAVITLGFTVGVYVYLERAVDASIAHAVAARNLVRSEQANTSQQQNIISVYEATAANRARLYGNFVPVDAVVTFIEAIENLGNETGSQVTLSGINADPLDGAVTGTTGKVSGHVTASGSWESVMRVLTLAEVLPYKVSTDNVALNVSVVPDGKNQKRVWNMSFDIQADSIVEASSSSPTLK